MAIPVELLPTTCDVYRPFGAGAATSTNVPCRLIADFGRAPDLTGSPSWTHTLVLNTTADIRDGQTRPATSRTLTYADGDEVRVPSGAATPRYVVIWVELVDAGTPREFKRAYLLRHAA